MPQPSIQYATVAPKTADCVVIGGGIIGAASAFYASRAGLRVVLLEKRSELCTLTTPVSAGAFRLQFDNREEMEMMRESVSVFERFGEQTGLRGIDIGIQRNGYLWLTCSAEGAARQQQLVARQRGWGLGDAELLSGDEARRRFPYLAPEVASARFRQGDGWLDVRSVTMGFAAASGAAVICGAAVTGIEIAGGRVQAVRTARRGQIQCNTAIIAAGPFSAAVAKLAGVPLPLEMKIRQRLVMPEVPEVPPAAPMTIDEDTGAHWRPAGRGAWLLYPRPDAPAGPPLEDVPADPEFYNTLLNPDSPTALARITPFWRKVWERKNDPWSLLAGQYDYTPDHRPLLGPAPIAGLAVNCGYSGHGIMGSAGGSRLCVDAMLGRVAPADNPFRLDRPMGRGAFGVL